MLVTFTDLKTNNPFAINPDHVVGVFVGIEGESEGKTLITLDGGSIVVSEDYPTVVSRLNTEMI